MFMERIEVPVVEVAKPRPMALKVTAGLLALPLFALIMVPWLAVLSIWVLLAGGARALVHGLEQLRDIIVYAGEVVVGR
jgi:uncharacterized membrane protein